MKDYDCFYRLYPRNFFYPNSRMLQVLPGLDSDMAEKHHHRTRMKELELERLVCIIAYDEIYIKGGIGG